MQILGQKSAEYTEEYFIHVYKAQGMILLNMTHNGRNFWQGGKPISRDDIEHIRESLGLPYTCSLF